MIGSNFGAIALSEGANLTRMMIDALATDYDDTLATHGQVDEKTLAALIRLRASGRKCLLVTGREYDDLLTVFTRVDLFDLIVAENGGLLVEPATNRQTLIAPPANVTFANRLRQLGAEPLSVGRTIIATRSPHENLVRRAQIEMAVDLRMIMNKGAIMLLPHDIDKATGLAVAARQLDISTAAIVGVGDAENDRTFLRACGVGVAVANALQSVQEVADLTTTHACSEGVVELIDIILAGAVKPRCR